MTIPPRAEIEALTGHRFAGGEYTIAHWENVLLTGWTGADLLPQEEWKPPELEVEAPPEDFDVNESVPAEESEQPSPDGS